MLSLLIVVGCCNVFGEVPVQTGNLSTIISKLWLMIYEINHTWTAEMKWKWRNDCRSECNLCNCVKKREKKNSGLQWGFLHFQNYDCISWEIIVSSIKKIEG